MEIKYSPVEGPAAAKLSDLFGVEDGGLIEVNPGQVLIPSKFMEVGQRIMDMEVRPDDVWLVSYPRTGSTWTQEMVWCIGNDLDFEGAKVMQSIRAPVLELTALLGNDKTGVIQLIGDTVEIVEKMPSPRFIKSHLPRELLPRQLYVVKPKIVYVCRNPKDMCVSYYHYCSLMHDLNGNFKDFCELFLQNKVPMGPIWNHILGFWELRNEPNILFLRFEEMKKDLKSIVERTAKFLKKDISPSGMTALLDHLSFQTMKANPAVNLEAVLEYRKQHPSSKPPSTTSDFIRKGEVGDWANHMDTEMSQRFDDWATKNLIGTDLTFVV